MAQVDTGLGWSAKGEYLLNTPILVGNIEEKTIPVLMPHVPYNQSPTPAQIASGGASFVVNGTTYYIMIATDTFVGNVGVGLRYNGVTCAVTLVSWDSGCSIGRYNTYISDGQTSWARWGSAARDLTLQASNGLYYAETVGLSDVNYNLFYNQPASDGTILTASGDINTLASRYAGQTIPVYKLNVGNAVCCFAKWITPDATVLISPIFISTLQSATVISTDGLNPSSQTETMFIEDGAHFYMHLLPGLTATNRTITNAVVPVLDLTQFGAAAPSKVFAIIADSSFANILVTETIDPYEDFGYTDEDAGEVNPDPEDDDIDFDDLPTKSFATAGFCRIFNPDVSDLNALASYMWTDQTFLQTVINHLKQILENPIEAIISLSMVPVQPPRGSTKVPVNVMYVNTGVSMYPVTNQFVEIDCGTLSLRECYGGALDYNPYTRVQIYLPYIGIVQLDTDEVMAKTLHLKYNIDVVTGICCAELKADNKLLYSFSGHCAVSQPITSADFSSYLNAAVAAAKVAVGVATGMASTTAGAAAAELPPAVPSKGPTSSALVPLQTSGAIGPHLGSPAMSSSRGLPDFSDIPEPESSGGVNWGELAKPGNVNTVASAMGGKMVVQHSGGFSGNSGYLAKRRPYLIIIRPRIANPRNYAQHFGRTSMEYLNLGSCTGYTKVQSVHLSGFDATNPEISEISSLLKGGVLM